MCVHNTAMRATDEKQYPVENEYSSYLSSNSGYSNAYTAATQTNYFFECAAVNESEHTTNGVVNGTSTTNGTSRGPLYGALDRFAQFFVQPLFLENTLDREMRAVDSENKKNLQNDMWRLSQLAKTLSNPKHPYHHFSTGNLKTLKEEPEKRGVKIRDEFIRFYEQHYSANRMKLVVLGRESLDELEEWVVELFSEIKNKDLPQNRWDDQRPLSKAELSTEIFAKPVMESRSLEISFPWQDEDEMFETQPARFLSHLIGHEGPGSILAYLKEKGLANSLSAGYHTVCPGSAFFEIEISLTPEGLKKYRDVVKIVFQYISLMKENPPVDWMHEEMKNMAEVDFRFRQKSPASRFTSGTSSVMQKPLPREWLLSGISKFRKFDPEGIVHAMQFLKDDNFRLMIVAQDYPGDWDQKEKWYGTDYKVQKFPVEIKEEFRQALSAPASERPEELYLPHRNEFIPTRLDVEKVEVAEPAKTPKLLRNDDKMRLWWKKDDSFWVPKANINILLRNGLTYATPANYVKTVLFTSLVKDALNTYSYDAEISGLVYNVVADPSGMNVLVHGYNDKMSVLLEKILTTIRDMEIRQDRFDIIKERKIRQYKNWDYQQPYHMIGDYTRWLLNEKAWMTHQYAAELPHITIEELRAFAPQLIAQAHIEAMVHGNLYRDEAKKIGTLVESTLQPRSLPLAQWHMKRNMILPHGSNTVYKTQLVDPENVNHGIEYYLQVGHVMDQDLRAQLQLFAQITEEPAFDQLRTKEQLGYVVWSGVRPAATMMGYRILIQSERDPEYLEGRCDAFLLKMQSYINDMSDSEFEGHKRSLITKRLEKLKNLDSETGRLWNYVSNEYFNFYQIDDDVATIRKLTKQGIIDFYTKFLAPESITRAKLAIHLEAKKQAAVETDAAEQKEHFAELIGQVAGSLNESTDQAALASAVKQVDITDQIAVVTAAKKELSSTLLPEKVEETAAKLDEAIPQAYLALKITPRAESADGEANEGDKTPMVEVPKPEVIEDVVRWKAGLEVSRAPVPVADLKQFEESEPKL